MNKKKQNVLSALHCFGVKSQQSVGGIFFQWLYKVVRYKLNHQIIIFLLTQLATLVLYDKPHTNDGDFNMLPDQAALKAMLYKP